MSPNKKLRDIFILLASSPIALKDFRQALLEKHTDEYREALQLTEAAVFDSKLSPLAAKQLGRAEVFAELAGMAESLLSE